MIGNKLSSRMSTGMSDMDGIVVFKREFQSEQVDRYMAKIEELIYKTMEKG